MHRATGAHYIPKAHHFTQMQADFSLSWIATSTGTKFVYCVCHLSITKRTNEILYLAASRPHSQVAKELTAVLSPQSHKPKSYIGGVGKHWQGLWVQYKIQIPHFREGMISLLKWVLF